ncbi:hypothetical protein CH76_11130 [Lysinibacillus sp. BF-4]|uniref:UPF0223 protein BN1050_01265 n=1 Tax=Metalysinibacillus saudimassiliensis TaxID=1461583 RepID=A0A078MCK9_9BACL|nr:UPF0223 family protein [Lysinibacillus sp. BF-4]KFL42687.1 hypothetical protein CH76_11130 [Lysinibacillus sp. BF-4]CEA02466.1 hypothetical protein BN1050_01265 [Metalysinibacillus saudimassiliensis]
MEYSYPLLPEWSTTEMIDVVKFFEAIELAYEKGVKREVMMKNYRRFKEIVPAQAEEKTLCREFEQSSGYVAYRVIKEAKAQADGTLIKMK